MAVNLSFIGGAGWQFLTNDAQPLSGGKLYTYAAGTTTPLTTYTSRTGATPNTNPIILDSAGRTPEQIWSTEGLLYKYVVKDSDDVTIRSWDNIGGSVVASDLAQDLAAPSGSSLVGFLQSGTGAVATTVQTKLRESVSVMDFGAVGDGVTNDTAAMVLAFASAASTKKSLLIQGTFLIDYLVLSSINGLHILGDGTIIASGLNVPATGTFIDWQNCSDVTVEGKLNISGNYIQAYTKGWWQRTTGSNASQYFDIKGIGFNAFTNPIWIGDKSLPDAIVSESSYQIRSTYGCISPITAEGLNTVVNFYASQILSNSFGGSAPWVALAQTTLTVTGANVIITGSELQHASTTTGKLIDFQPLTSALLGGTVWGQLRIVNGDLETAAPLVVTSNPDALGSPVLNGLIEFSGCTGAHTQDITSFVQTDSTYIGDIVIDNNCRFYKPLGAVRFQPNATILNAACNLWIGDNSFGKNFVQGLQGISGGTIHFDKRNVLFVSNCNAQTLALGTATTLKWTNVGTGNDLNRFAGGYSAATGIFTVPANGLKSATLTVSLRTTQPSQPLDIAVYANGALAAVGATMIGGASNSGWSRNTFDLGDLTGGTQVYVQAIQSGVASTTNGGVYETMILSCRN